MKIKLIVAISVLMIFASCTSQRAVDLRDEITANDEQLKNIMVSKGSAEEEKLNCLINKDFEGALGAIDKQEQQFDSLIKKTAAFSVEGVKGGDSLKVAAINYYQALKILHMADREEIAQQVITYNDDTAMVRRAQDKMLELSKQKQTLFQQVYDKDEKMQTALGRFDKENGL
ncbi:hypothetical protein [Olivibacter domesticus]|uniref:DUF4142 domain-containing protein n=1 Tax=Olivibacter domesticus TaxID=407022 RepID=A0A1H7GYK2_OLID1|nr:hypothetical protein [Olivibacter domesticus]SEK42587.1 hypothetical protein SAMN05661044_00216 [Olivibacter domesticus]